MAEGKLITELEVKQVDPEARTIEGYAATFGNLDLNGDVIDKKAFDKTLKDKSPSDIAVFVGHNSSMLPIGIPVEMHVDDKGLFTKTRVFKTQAGDDLLQTARELQQAGQPLGMSIGFQTRDAKWQTKDGKTYRLLTDADLMEYSYAAKQVIASPPALVTAVKTRTKGAGMAEHEHFAPGEQPVWSTAFIQGLPDSAFAYIEEGGEEVEGKTLPHTLRHFPHHNEDGSVNVDALQHAVDRAAESPFKQFAYSHLRTHAEAEGLPGFGDGAKIATAAISEIGSTFADLSLECADVARALNMGAKLGFDGQKVGVRLKGTMRAKLKNISAALEELIAWAENLEEQADQDGKGNGTGKTKTRGPARRAEVIARYAAALRWDGKEASGDVPNLDDLHSAIDHIGAALDLLGGDTNEDSDDSKEGKARKAKWDPDGDGDDDSTPEGDTDHDHWTADGRQLKPVPGKPLNGKSWSPEVEEEKGRKAGADGEGMDHLKSGMADLMSHHDSLHPDHKITKIADQVKSVWSSKYVSDLPDSAFAMVYTTGDGQKVRKLPHHDSSGKVDMPHLRNALSRGPQMKGDPSDEEQKAMAHLEKHAKDAGMRDEGKTTRKNGKPKDGPGYIAALHEMEATLAKYGVSIEA